MQALKEEGNALFKQRQFESAMTKYTEALQTLQAEAGESSVIAVKIDVADKESVKAAAALVEKELGARNWGGGLDAVVNFAGVIRGGALVEIDDRDMELVLDVNIKGTFLVNKYLFPLLLLKKGRVVNISSEVALSWLSAGFNAPYSMSKFAIEAYSAALRQELQLLDMQVVVINPGAMRTPLLTAQLQGGNNAFLEKPPTDSLFAAAMRRGAAVAQVEPEPS